MAEEQARKSGGERIHAIRIRIGRMSGVVPDALQCAFEVLRAGTLAAEGKLEIEATPVVCWCAGCQKEFPSEDLMFECPACGQPSGKLVRGREMEITSLEIS